MYRRVSLLVRIRDDRRRVAMGVAAIGACTALTAAALGVAPWASAPASGDPGGTAFVQTNLVSDLANQGAQLPDASLLNPWGLAFGPTTPLWVSDNNSGVATLYHIGVGGQTVTKQGLTVTVPGGRASTGDGSSPTGQVFNPTTGFVVSTTAGSGSAFFIFDSESGQLSAWNPTADPINAASGTSTGTLEYTSPTAVYKGLTIATGDEGTFLYAANFHDGTVDVFNSSFQLTQMPGGFSDPSIPDGYAPFGIQDIHNLIYVTYAKQNATAHDDVAGPGHGFIDVYTPDGFLVQRLASRGSLDSPWGMAIAPSSFGRFAGMLLVGNFGNGRINVFNPFTGLFMGQLSNTQGQPLTIDGLWSLKVGTASTGGTQTVLFSAGINGEADGLLGSINAAS
jgi:uncharacterized protein (TIGR03118 family)